MKTFELMKNARAIVEACAAVKPTEKVCIVSDTQTLAIAEALAAAASSLGAETVITVMLPAEMHGNEPPKVVAAAMKAADVVIAPTTYSFTHTVGFKEALQSGTRAVILRGITEDIMLHGAAGADYGQVQRITKKLRDLMSQASQARVLSDFGTNLSLSIKGRPCHMLSGIAHTPGSFTAMPDGEVAVAPIEGSTQGTLVIDHAMDGLGFLEQPITMEVKNGRVVSIQGGKDAEKLQRLLAEADEGAYNIAEFALGTNPKARLIGSMSEDKKLLGTVHIAVGDSFTLGGNVHSKIHLDGVIRRPTVELDGKMVVDKGKALFAD